MEKNQNVTNIREIGVEGKNVELERLSVALQTAQNSLAEVKATLDDEREGRRVAEGEIEDLKRDLDTLRRSNSELRRRLGEDVDVGG